MRKVSPLRKRLRNAKTLVRKRTRFLRSKKPERERELPDPFTVIGAIPKGRAYQWISYAVLGDETAARSQLEWFLEAGWKAVPARRHPDMPRDKKGRIVHGGQMLVERSAKDVAAAQARKHESAREQFQHAIGSASGRGHTVHYIDPEVSHYRNAKITPEQRAAWDEEIKQYGDARYAVFDISIGLVLTDGERDIANHLAISPREYAFRKFMMLADVLQLQNDHGSQRDHIKIFDLVRLTTEKQ